MNTKNIKSIVGAGMLLLPVLPAPAMTEFSTLTLQLTCYRQGETDCVDDVFTGRVDIVRLGSRQLIRIISDLSEISFPNGSRIEIASNGNAYVVAPRHYRPRVESEEIDVEGPIRWNVTSYLRANFETENELIHGRYHKITGEERSTLYFSFEMWFDTPSSSCHVAGLAIERFFSSRANRDGRKTQSSTTVSTVNGYGETDMIDADEGTGSSGAAFYVGRVVLRGRETLYLK